MQLDFQRGCDKMQAKVARDHMPTRVGCAPCQLVLLDKHSLHGRQESKPIFPSVGGS